MAPVMRALACLPLAALLSCDALVEQSYRGSSLGRVYLVVANESGKTFSHPHAAVFWAERLEERDLAAMHEQISSSQPVRDGAGYVLNIFETPEPLLPWSADDADGPKFALGRVAVYDDLNRNARRDRDEPIIGGLGPYAAIYAPETLPAGVGPSRREVPTGLHFTWLPLKCKPDPEPTSEDCDVPIGQACQGPDSGGPMSCGEGVCVDRYGFPWPGGACLVEQKKGCVPANGVPLSGGPGGPYYARACQDDSDCERAAPYRCDPLAGACVPFNVPRVSLGDVPTPPFCSGP